MTTTAGPRDPKTSAAMPKPVLLAVIGVLLLIVAAAGFGLSQLGRDGGQPNETILKSVSPGENDKILQQGQVKVELMTGWDGTLSIDQRAIPRDQLIRNNEERLASYQTLIFQPGKGKVFESFAAGQHCATVTYWLVSTGPSQSFTKDWCFTAF